ncbi:MAG: hypothetical protein IKV92_03265 [Akkermansia sp.]|nr:hypothetical protein [Akkermansia sp.]
MSQIHVTSVGLSQEGKSPYWVAQWSFADGKRVKKSTKVPVAGGMFRGEKLTRVQAKNRALMVARELDNAAAVEAERVMRQPMLDGFYQWARERFEAGLAASGDAAVYVLPRLRVHSNPSQEFTQLVRLHGIGLQNGGGAGRRRTWHSKTFHCLRASVATMLQAAGGESGACDGTCGP